MFPSRAKLSHLPFCFTATQKAELSSLLPNQRFLKSSFLFFFLVNIFHESSCSRIFHMACTFMNPRANVFLANTETYFWSQKPVYLSPGDIIESRRKCTWHGLFVQPVWAVLLEHCIL